MQEMSQFVHSNEDCFRDAPGLYFSKDINGIYTACNDTFAHLAGMQSPEEVIGKTDYELSWRVHAGKFRENDQEVIVSGQEKVFEEFIISSNGERVTYLVSKRPQFDGARAVVGLSGFCTDITRYKEEAGNALLNLEQVVACMPGSVYWKDREGVYLGCNDGLADLLGIPRSEVPGKTDYDFAQKLGWPDEVVDAFVTKDREIIATGKARLGFEEPPFKFADGRMIYQLDNKIPLRDIKGDIVGVVGIGIDVTERKQAEAEITKYKEEARNALLNLEQVVACMPGSVYWKNRDGVYLGCNDELANWLGLPRSEVLGKTDYDFAQKLGWSDEIVDAFVTKDREIIATGKARLSFEEPPFKLADGRTIYQLDNKMPLRDINGNIVGVVGIGTDITERKQAESKAASLKLEMERERQQKEILQLEKKAQQFLEEQQARFNKIVDEAVHDIRSPLSVINSTLSSCQELPEEKRTRLRKSLNHAINILYNLESHRAKGVNAASTGVESRQNLLIADYVAEIVDEKKYQYINHPIDFEVDITDAAKTAHVDSQPNQLSRALSNIINNAIDALPENQNGVIKVLVNADEKWVEIIIQDNGIGMSLEAIKKIQQRISFSENKLHGHGLGLQQVGEMLEYNQGKMEINSVVGKGTSFQLFFPRSTPASWLAQEIVLQPDTIVLLLEDDTTLHVGWQILLHRFLSRYPTFMLKCFVEGEEVLRFVQTLTDKERIRVLLLADYELTYQQQNGLQIIIDSQINNAILITGHSSNAEVRKAAMERGINLLPKQFIDKVPIRLATNLYGEGTAS